jgi:uncharacterized membrane protein (UPF0127 family)
MIRRRYKPDCGMISLFSQTNPLLEKPRKPLRVTPGNANFHIGRQRMMIRRRYKPDCGMISLFSQTNPLLEKLRKPLRVTPGNANFHIGRQRMMIRRSYKPDCGMISLFSQTNPLLRKLSGRGMSCIKIRDLKRLVAFGESVGSVGSVGSARDVAMSWDTRETLCRPEAFPSHSFRVLLRFSRLNKKLHLAATMLVNASALLPVPGWRTVSRGIRKCFFL